MMARYHNVFEHAHIGEKLYVLECAGYAPGRNEVRGKQGDVFCSPGNVSNRRPQKAGYYIEYRCLSSAVRTNQAYEFTSFKGNGEIAHRNKPAELLCYMAHLEKRVHEGVLAPLDPANFENRKSQLSSLRPIIPFLANRITSKRIRLKITIRIPGIPGMVNEPELHWLFHYLSALHRPRRKAPLL